jgi:hypothetical protein
MEDGIITMCRKLEKELCRLRAKEKKKTNSTS